MSVRFDAAADRLLRTTNLPSYDANYSLLFWFYLTSGTLSSGTYSTLFSLNNNNVFGPVDHIDLIGVSGNTARLNVFTQNNGGSFTETIGTTALAASTWYCVGFIRSANNSRIAYLGTLTSLLTQECNHTTSQSGRTAPSRMEFGGATSGNTDPLSTPGARIGPIKIWTTNLTLAELQQEQFLIRPSFTASIHIWSPTFPGATTRAIDYSGNGYNWTEGGTLTDEDPPPISWGNRIIHVPSVPSSGTTYNLTTSVSSTTTTPDNEVNAVSRNLPTIISSAATTPDNQALAISRPFAATISSASSAPDNQDLTVTGQINLTTAVSSTSTTPDNQAVSISRLAITAISSDSTTPDNQTVAIARAITSAISSAVTTPNNQTLAATRAYVTSITSAATTPNNRAWYIGRYALRFYGGGNSDTIDKVYIPCGNSDAVNVGQTDFTIEMFVRAPVALQDGTATAGANYSWINSPIIFDRDILGSLGSGGDFGISMTDGRITFGVENSGGSQRTIIGTSDLRDDAWHHIAVTRTRSNGDMAVYVDGAREAVSTSGPTGDIHIASNTASSTWNRYIALGGEKHAIDWAQGQWVGRIDELRISTALRYTGTSYTVPDDEFSLDSNTAFLSRFNDGTGTLLGDITANANHGALSVGGSPAGPEWVISEAFVIAMTVAISSASSTPNNQNLLSIKSFTASISSASATPNTANLQLALPTVTVVNSASATPNNQTNAVTRNLTSSVSSASSTPDNQVEAVQRNLATMIGSLSSTPDSQNITTAVTVTASILSISSTPDGQLIAISRSVAASAGSTSLTPDNQIETVARALVAVVSSVSATPDNSNLTVEGTIDFATAISSTSSTPNGQGIAVSRLIASTVPSITTTPDNHALVVAIPTATTVSSLSSTPNTAELVTGFELSTVVNSTSTTPNGQAIAVSRSLLAATSSASVVPGDSILARLIIITVAVSSLSSANAPDLNTAEIIGQISLTFTAKPPGVTFVQKRPGITFTGE